MSDSNADFLVALAASTALPDDGGTHPSDNGGITATLRPFTRSHVLTTASPRLNNVDAPLRATGRARSKRAAPFTIFCDPLTSSGSPSAAASSGGPALKRAKTVKRLPLAPRSLSSTNSTPLPSPRSPDLPYTMSRDDPFWENIENVEPIPCTQTSTTSSGMEPSTTPFLMRPSLGPLPHRSNRAPRARRTSVQSTRSRTIPRSMELYILLGLQDWNVSSEEIRAAYRRAALEQHPDRVTAEEHAGATLRMQQLNAARDLLLNEQSRQRYHVDGRVPWARGV